ncbi:hypothetical protein ATI61_104141 [Archangium gephyra]|uniref:DUF4148 domain-containing protein n=1 Tax=Archangium gephyra TaxID=48 RepID=A0AAC8TDE9_9BACT|nr:hypothetical protein [Archangium gephyra]AKJ00451.1 Hypothetical protein AA314_02077 [Archangium gephyra]REG32851.1 hypothetical protein ATI61_104141 [Archangium gephyra]
MSPRIKVFAVLIGVGLASSAGAAERTETSVGPFRASAVQTQKTVGPSVFSAVQTQKTVGPRIYAAVRTQKAVGATGDVQFQGAAERKTTGQAAPLDLNAGF